LSDWKKEVYWKRKCNLELSLSPSSFTGTVQKHLLNREMVWRNPLGGPPLFILVIPLTQLYSKHPHVRTYDFGVQANQVLICWVLSEKSVWKCSYGHSPVLHCASLLRIISRVISACALKNGGFFFTAGPRHKGKSSFSRKRVPWQFSV